MTTQKFHTLELAIEFYHMVEKMRLPRHLRDQMLRAASSVALNLSEGNVKRSLADKKRFFEIAFGSLRECQTILKLCSSENKDLQQSADRIAACLFKLIHR